MTNYIFDLWESLITRPKY